MAQDDIALMAHLMRRAGFGATRDELERYVAKGYKATVEELLHPENAPAGLEDEDLLRRYHVDYNSYLQFFAGASYWLYRMINTKRPLEEKIALFWHGVFATGYTKLNQPKAISNQIKMFRRHGLGDFRTLLVQISKDPAMMFWLDNVDNHKGAVNENFGRELLELFSLGVGNYNEDDVRQASRAFTGWTIRNVPYMAIRAAVCSTYPYARLDWQFQYLEEDHDDGEKTFLGETGRFNGEDIIDIIVRQPAAARFICRHLYTFFVADEPQVPAWETVGPRDPEAIDTLVDTFTTSGYDIRSVLRVLFNSDSFKNARFEKVKSPTELIIGAARIAGTHRSPVMNHNPLSVAGLNMGQQLLDPPSVEGWHTGNEWLTTGSLVDRVNFAAEQFGDPQNPGVVAIVDRIKAQGTDPSPESVVDACLDLMGPITVSDVTKRELAAQAGALGEIRFGSEEEARSSTEKIKTILQLIVATREYQLA